MAWRPSNSRRSCAVTPAMKCRAICSVNRRCRPPSWPACCGQRRCWCRRRCSRRPTTARRNPAGGQNREAPGCGCRVDRALVRILSFRPARKIIGPRQRCLAGDGFQENPCSVGIGGAFSQSQAGARCSGQRILQADHLECRSPPPARCRRSRVFGDLAPPHEFINDTFELQICGPMHDFPDSNTRRFNDQGDRSMVIVFHVASARSRPRRICSDARAGRCDRPTIPE